LIHKLEGEDYTDGLKGHRCSPGCYLHPLEVDGDSQVTQLSHYARWNLTSVALSQSSRSKGSPRCWTATLGPYKKS